MITKFTFAGFNFPKAHWTLPKGSLSQRLIAKGKPVCSGYILTPTPNSKQPFAFYLGETSFVDLRWRWCDEINSRIRHTGWYADEHYDSKYRGIVVRLPKGRGFLCGCSMGEGMISWIDVTWVIETAEEAARAADDMARRYAEEQMEHEQAEREKEEQAEREMIKAFGEEIEQ